MAYDAARGIVLLFGGTGGAGGTADTWTWDGATWTPLYPLTSPPPRVGAVMAYDSVNERIVLYGGCLPGPQNCLPAYDTWTWDGTTWTRQTLASPSGRHSAGLAAGGPDRLLLFGGSSLTEGALRDTWIWRGTP